MPQQRQQRWRRGVGSQAGSRRAALHECHAAAQPTLRRHKVGGGDGAAFALLQAAQDLLHSQTTGR